MVEKKSQKKNFLTSWKSVKDEIDHFVKKNELSELQSSVKKIVQTAQKDINSWVDKDFGSIKKKFLSEKKQVEKLVDRVVTAEIKKAKKFVATKKKEIDGLQKSLEDHLKIIQREASEASKKVIKRKAGKKSAKKTAKASSNLEGTKVSKKKMEKDTTPEVTSITNEEGSPKKTRKKKAKKTE